MRKSRPNAFKYWPAQRYSYCVVELGLETRSFSTASSRKTNQISSDPTFRTRHLRNSVWPQLPHSFVKAEPSQTCQYEKWDATNHTRHLLLCRKAPQSLAPSHNTALPSLLPLGFDRLSLEVLAWGPSDCWLRLQSCETLSLTCLLPGGDAWTAGTDWEPLSLCSLSVCGFFFFTAWPS